MRTNGTVIGFTFMLAIVWGFGTSQANAWRDMSARPTCKSELINNSLVIIGKPVNSSSTSPEDNQIYTSNSRLKHKQLPPTYTDFEVITTLKGEPEKKVRVYYYPTKTDKSCLFGKCLSPPVFAKDSEHLIFAKSDFEFLIGSTAGAKECSLLTGELGAYKFKSVVLDALISKFPDNATFYEKRASLMMELNDYAGIAHLLSNFLTRSDVAKLSADGRFLLVKSLYIIGKYNKALSIIADDADSEELSAYKYMSLLKLGRAQELSGRRIVLRNQILSGITISNVDLSGADFSGSHLVKVTFENVTLSEAVFTNASLNGEMNNVDAAGANFDNSSIGGKIRNSYFEQASFKNARLDLIENSDNQYTGADFTSAQLYILEGRTRPPDLKNSDFAGAKFTNAQLGGIGGSKTTGADFTGAGFYSGKSPASFNQGLDLSGQKLDGSNLSSSDFSSTNFRNASLKNVTFSGSNLSSVDFKGADLTNADFSVSRYSGPTKLFGANMTNALVKQVKWGGAHYDCQTRFPRGFLPQKHELELHDTTCKVADSEESNAILYSPDRLGKGYIDVCGGKFESFCTYSFLLQYAFYARDRRAGPFQVAQSLFEAGELDLARILTLRLLSLPNKNSQIREVERHQDHILLLAKIYRKLNDRTKALELLRLGEVANQKPRPNGRRPMRPDYQISLIEEWAALGELTKAEQAFTNYFTLLEYRGSHYDAARLKMLSAMARGYMHKADWKMAVETALRIKAEKLLATQSLQKEYEAGALAQDLSYKSEPGTFKESYQRAIVEAQRYSQPKIINSDNYLESLSQLALARYAQGERNFLDKYLQRVNDITGNVPTNDPYPGFQFRYAQEKPRDFTKTAVIDILSGTPIEDIADKIEGGMSQLVLLPGVAEAIVLKGGKKYVWQVIQDNKIEAHQKLSLLNALAKNKDAMKDDDAAAQIKSFLQKALNPPRPMPEFCVVYPIGSLTPEQALLDLMTSLKFEEGVYDIVAFAEKDKRAEKKFMQTNLRAATSLAKMGLQEKAWSHFEKFLAQFDANIRDPHEKTYWNKLLGDEVSAFVYAISSQVSAATRDRALSLIQELPSKFSLSDIGNLRLVAASLKLGSNISNEEVRLKVLPSLLGRTREFLNMLQEIYALGFDELYKELLPKAVVRLQYSDERLEKSYKPVLIRQLYGAGELEGAESFARTTFDSTARVKVQGLSVPDHLILQDLLLEIFQAALQAQQPDIALDILTSYLYEPIHKASAYHFLADYHLNNGDKERAKKHYAFAIEAASNMIDLAISVTDGKHKRVIDMAWIKAKNEFGLSEFDAFKKTRDFIRAAIPILSNQPDHKVKTLEILERLETLKSWDTIKAEDVFDRFKKEFSDRDANTVTPIREAWALLMKDNKNEVAREALSLGLDKVKVTPHSSSKASIIIRYADLVARTPPLLNDEERSFLESLILATPSREEAAFEKGAAKKTTLDYLSRGQEFLSEAISEHLNAD